MRLLPNPTRLTVMSGSRTYHGVVDTPIEVLDIDAGILTACGWLVLPPASTQEGGGATTFAQLTDVAAPFYAGNAGRVPVVNLAEDTLAPRADPTENVYLQGGHSDAESNSYGGNTVVQGGDDVDGGGAGDALLIGGGEFGGATAAGDAYVRGGDASTPGKNGGNVSISTGTPGDGGAAGSLKINGNTAVPSQSVLVAGVGTMVFTHGILTSFTPA